MTDPHPAPEEDPEQHIGEEIPDPWDDDDRGDLEGVATRWM